jgi:acyl-CoA synthetase (AMP-forming)/AMP-acid ligase II
VSDAAARAPGKTAIRFEGRELGYRELEQRVGALAGILGRSGVASGDRVAYLGPNPKIGVQVGARQHLILRWRGQVKC